MSQHYNVFQTSLSTLFQDKMFSNSFFKSKKLFFKYQFFFAILATKIHCTDVIEIVTNKCATGGCDYGNNCFLN